MQAKPIASFFVVALALMAAARGNAQESSGGAAKPPPAIPVVLYADPLSESDNVPQPILSARDALRSDRRLEVLLFNPESPTFVLGARHANLSLSPDTVSTLDQRKAMTQAVSGSFFAVLSRHGKRSKTVDAGLYEIAPVEQSWSYLDRDPNALAQDMAGQIVTATAQPVPASQPLLTPPILPALPAQTPAPPINIPASPSAVSVPLTPVIIAPIAPAVSTKPLVSAPPPTPAAQPVPAPKVVPPTLPAPAPVVPILAPVVPILAPVVPSVPPSPIVKAVPSITPKTPPILAQAPAPQVAPTISDTPLPVPPVSHAPIASTIPHTTPETSPPVAAAPVIAAPVPQSVTPVIPSVPTVAEPPPAPVPAIPVTVPAPEINLPATPPPGSVVSDDARRLMTTGDQEQRSSDYDAAIDTYRQAINLAPRAAEPRLKLAQAFLQAGMRDQAIKEARRALALDPNSQDARDFLTTLGASDSDETQIPTNQANVTANPKDQTAWISLGDSCWNANKLPEALAAYKSAVDLNPSAVAPQARLARFYAAQGDYDQSLTALDKAGSGGYPFALEIIASETENLFGEIDASEELFERGENTREQCYKRLKAADQAAQGLADFVAKVKPPDPYKLSHLHRQLSTRLLAQDTAGWLSYTETGEVRYKSIALTLEKEAVREMETAAAAELARSSAANR